MNIKVILKVDDSLCLCDSVNIYIVGITYKAKLLNYCILLVIEQNHVDNHKIIF
jgi:hypothetical protein